MSFGTVTATPPTACVTEPVSSRLVVVPKVAAEISNTPPAKVNVFEDVADATVP